jgi:hypothetical protein
MGRHGDGETGKARWGEGEIGRWGEKVPESRRQQENSNQSPVISNQLS